MPKTAAEILSEQEDVFKAYDRRKREALERSKTNSLQAAKSVNDALKQDIRFNPSVMNYTLDFSPDTEVLKTAPQITNVPNSVVIIGHGMPNSKGFYTGDQPRGKTGSALVNKYLADHEYWIANGMIGPEPKPDISIPIEDIAKGLGGATNAVKKAFIISCYNAGYTYSDIKKVFPNVDKIIATRTDMPTSGYYASDLFRPKDDKKIPHWVKTDDNSNSMLAPLFNMTPTSTNEINYITDWNMDPFPIPLLPKNK